MRKKEERKRKINRNKLTLKHIIQAKLPSAIEARITPILTTGCATLAATLIVLLIPTVRPLAWMFLLLGALMTGFGLWQKADVLRRGYDEHIFKVVDYTGFSMGRMSRPTGILLIKPDTDNSSDGNMYHIAASGKNRNLPPIDWLVRVYVPKGMEAAEYGDRKYFPIVYGYRIEGEDKE